MNAERGTTPRSAFRVQLRGIGRATDAFPAVLDSHAMSAAEIIAELPRLSPSELAEVQARLRELLAPDHAAAGHAAAAPQVHAPAAHPAVGIWKGRTDLPEDPVGASASCATA